MFKTRTMLFAGALAAGLTAGAMASDNTVNEQLKALRAELDAVRASNSQLQGQVAQLRSASDENWLNERRAEEVKSLVKEVLADADTRASLLEGGMTAGYNKKFFLASEDGSFKLELAGQVQFRYIYNNIDEDPNGDDVESGFQLRRTKLKFGGHIGNPKIKYALALASHRNTGDMYLEEAKISYALGNGLTISAGRFKAPFAREELTSSSKQLTVERSVINETFTVGFVEGFSLGYATDTFGVTGMISDGAGSGECDSDDTAKHKDWKDDTTDFAFTARVEAALIGKLKDGGDYSSWSKDATSLLVGAAFHYETGEGDKNADTNLYRWTLDAGFKSNGFGAAFAIFGEGGDLNTTTARDENIGLVGQVSYMVVPDTFEPFFRWEHFIDDGKTVATDHDFDIVTFGFNWYQHKHNSKFTLDVVYILDDLDVSLSSGLGLRTNGGLNGEEGEMAIRAQYQLLF
jgi:hypothetical protein